MRKKIIIWFSCGVTSAVAAKLAVERYGADNVDVWYIQIKSAHIDNFRFIRDCEKWMGVKIKTASSKKYADQFEVIRDTGYVNGPGGARCTTELKKQVRFDIQKQYPSDTIQIFGFEFAIKEINRALRFLQQYPSAHGRFPLIERRFTKEECAEIIIEAGIKLPKMYLLGYHNNNCIGCTKGGKGYWNKIRIDFPLFFLEMAECEREAGRSCINGTFLDELNPNDGHNLKPVVPDCGSLCEIKFVDILDTNALLIFSDAEDIHTMYEFYDLL